MEMKRLWATAVAVAFLAVGGSAWAVDTVVTDVDPPSFGAFWVGNDTNPSATLINSNADTQEAWSEAICACSLDQIAGFQNIGVGGDQKQLTNFDPGDVSFEYFVIKEDGRWWLFQDTDNNDLISTPSFENAVSHYALYNGNGATVPEPATLLLIGSGLVSIGAFAKARRRN